MSKKYGFGVKLAVAALAVAGVAGTVSAQSVVGSIDADGENFKAAVTMGVGYEVVKEAKIEVTANNPTKDDILGIDPTVTEVSGSTNGNLGLIKVTTNSPGWDILLATDNGGRLTKGSRTPGAVTSVWDNSCLCIKPDTAWTMTGVNLKYAGQPAGAGDVPLKVAIGMLDNVNGTIKVLKGIPSQDAVAAGYAAAEVDSQKLWDSKTPATPVSFIETLATTAASAEASGKHIRVGGVNVIGSGAGTATTDGFGPTADEYYPAASGVKRDGSEWFFVNVGIDATDAGGHKIGSNEEGEYKETFTFTLRALF